jgi:hypothetical protein
MGARPAPEGNENRFVHLTPCGRTALPASTSLCSRSWRQRQRSPTRQHSAVRNLQMAVPAFRPAPAQAVSLWPLTDLLSTRTTANFQKDELWTIPSADVLPAGSISRLLRFHSVRRSERGLGKLVVMLLLLGHILFPAKAIPQFHVVLHAN